MRLLNGHAIIFALVVTACGKADPERPPAVPSDHVAALVEEAETRILSMSDPVGWVVSRWVEDGRVEHTGDSVLFTGIALGASSCETGDVHEAALLAMLQETGGTVYRHPSQRERQPSLDSHLGLWWGISERVERCPASRDKWASAMAHHKPLNVPGVFDVVLDALFHKLGLAPAPSSGSLRDLEVVMAGWAHLVVATRSAGYRIHLGLLALETAGAGRDAFCGATEGAGLLTVDHFCGRDDLQAFVSGFEWNQYEYRFQRAHWESPDGKEGLDTPGLDLRVALRKAFDR